MLEFVYFTYSFNIVYVMTRWKRNKL